MSNTPSLAELLAFADAFDWEGWAEPKNAQAAFAKAVLARWGTPQPVVREPLKRVGTIKSWTNGSYWRNYKVEWHSDALVEGTQLYAEIPEHSITQKGGSNVPNA